MLTTVVRPLLRLAIAALLAMSGLVLATTAPAFACKCDSTDVAKQAARADTVFVAEVGAVTKVEEKYEYALTATHVYKGTVERDTAVTTNRATTACGLGELKAGSEYVFLVSGTTPPYAATSCGGSGPLNAKRLSEVEGVLGAGQDIKAPPPPAPTEPTMTKVEQSAPTPVARVAAPGGALLLIGLLGLLVVGRLARR